MILGSQFSQAAYTPNGKSIDKHPQDYLLVDHFVRMTVSEFQQASGHKLNFFQKIYFKKLQRKLKKANLYPGATILPYYNVQNGKFKFDSLWFVLGVIIGPFALLFSLTSRQGKNQRLSALIGFGVWVIWFGYIFLF